MSEDRSGSYTADRLWIDKIALLFSSEPRTRRDLEDVLTLAVENEVIDQDARNIMEGAMQVSDMQARDIMIPRTQMVVIKADTSLEEILPQKTSIEEFQVEHEFKQLGRRTMLLNARTIRNPLRKTERILLAIEDINKAGGIKSLGGAKIEPLLGDADRR